MFNIFLLVFKKIAFMLMFIAFGYYFARGCKTPKDSAKIFSKVEKDFVLPVYLFLSLMNSFTISNIKSNLRLIIIGCILVVIMALCGLLFANVVAHKDKNIRVYWYALTLSNYGYFGLPLVEAVFGEEIKAIMVAIAIPIKIFNYSFAVGVLQKEKKKKFKINMTLIALFLGVICGLFMKDKAKDVFNGLLTGISKSMSPMAMILLGLSLGSVPFNVMFKSKRGYIVSVIRLIVIPLIVGLIAYLANLRGNELMMATLIVSMPVGMNTVVFFKGEEKDRYIGAQCAVISMVLALITIPLITTILTAIM